MNEGLEYLPMSLAKSTSKQANEDKEKGGYPHIECSPYTTNAKCSAIRNELRPFNYDLEAWQLAHPEKMLISRPELFTNPDSKEQWLTALNNKITESKEILIQTKEQEADKLSKITRLETKIQELTKVKEVISQSTQTDPELVGSRPWYQEVIERLKKTFTTETREQGTQTDLTSQHYEQQQKEIKELREKISRLTVKK